jgi:hypothetical protein
MILELIYTGYMRPYFVLQEHFGIRDMRKLT